MGLVQDTPDWILERLGEDRTCHFCGEEEATVIWDNFTRDGNDGLLALCDSCTLSIGGGILIDLALKGTAAMPEIWMDLVERLRHTISIRMENMDAKTVARYERILKELEEY